MPLSLLGVLEASIRAVANMLNAIFTFHLFFFLILFIYFWLRWVFVAARGLSLVAASGGYSCGTRASHCGGFSC